MSRQKRIFKLPEVPSASPSLAIYREEWMDYWELLTLCSPTGTFSLSDLHRQYCDRLAHGSERRGEPAIRNPRIESQFEELVSVYYDRVHACGESSAGDRYPFALSGDGDNVLSLHPVSDSGVSFWRWLYAFLILATRLNMHTSRVHGLMDGTQLFEDICQHVIRGLFGPRTRAIRFGAGGESERMKGRLRDLCNTLAEGAPKRKVAQAAGDGGLDLVGWLEFADNRLRTRSTSMDGRCGKLIVFAQCKTGTNYDARDVAHSSATIFMERYLDEHFGISSAQIFRLFFISERPNTDAASDLNRHGALLIDRCRIVDAFPEPTNEGAQSIQDKVREWVHSALQSVELRDLLPSGVPNWAR